MAKVLVVEDDADSRDVIVRALGKGGHQVRAVADGREALDHVLREDADVIVLDLRMPVMDGLAFMKVVRSYLRFQDVPVIVVTASTDSLELDRLMVCGVARVFTKSKFDLTDFVACVEQLAAGRPWLPLAEQHPHAGAAGDTTLA